MNLRTFIERPILSTVVSVLIVVMGLISLSSLPMETFPDIAPPTIQVSATYYGASAETIQKAVIAPLEEAINGVEHMTYMTSSATNSGTATITVYFEQGSDPDMAQVNVQNRISRANGSLPSEVVQVGVTVFKRQTSILQVFSLYSPKGTYDGAFLTNYVDINLKPRILRVDGVGDMFAMGGNYSMRVWMKPDVMAQYNMIPSDITYALAQQNIESATGSFGENAQGAYQYTMKYKGRLLTPEEFGEIVIRSTADGQVLKLKDVAELEFGQVTYGFHAGLDGANSTSAMIFQTPGSNATAVNNEINSILEDAKRDLPEDVEMTQIMSSNDFLDASVKEVAKTLIETIILVILVVYLFLQDFRSSLIPLVGIIVSLIGTFAFMYLLGFSINLITLFALVLVIGTVVDDSIVVVEAVQSRFDAGYRSSYDAAVDGMKGISNAILVSSLVFMAVFIPVSFMSGTSGIFYKQFGLTMAAAVGFSAINALTMSPALCALFVKPYLNEDGTMKDNFAARFRKAFNAAFGAMLKKYKAIVKFFVNNKWFTWGILIASVVLLVFLMKTTKTGMVPDEDQGVVLVDVTAAPGASLHTTRQQIEKVKDRIRMLPEVHHVMHVAGYGLTSGQSSSGGMLMVRLKNWDLRKGKDHEVKSIINKIYGLTMDIKDVRLIAMAPGMIPGYGLGNSLNLNMQDLYGGDLTQFYTVTQQYLGALNQRPEIQMALTGFDIRFPQWQVEVDASKCLRAGITPSSVLSTLAGYYGGQYVSNINRFSKVYYVMIQADPQYRMDEKSLDNVFVRMNDGQMAPISQFVSLTKVYGAEVLSRFNLYNSISVNVMPNPGYSTGEALKAVKEVAAVALPRGYGYDFGGITREENEQTGGGLVYIFAICTLVIYLILCALYESFLIPIAVILSVPCGLMGTFLFAKLFGVENNIYLQMGMIMLIGLLSKTAILLTEYASERRRAGMSITEAAVSAAEARLRPILMTALTMIVGLFPLIVATGVGANGYRSLGTGVIGGMVIGTLVLLFIVPALFITFQWLQEKVKPMKFETPNEAQAEVAE